MLCVKSRLCVRHVCMYQHACMEKCLSQCFFLRLLRFIFLFFLLQFLHMNLLFTNMSAPRLLIIRIIVYFYIFVWFHVIRSSYLYLSLCPSTLSGHPSSSFFGGGPLQQIQAGTWKKDKDMEDSQKRREAEAAKAT